MLYPLLYPFFAKEYQGIPKTKIKNVDLTGSIIFVVSKSPMDLMEPILL